jgi:hypothetical protein
LQPQHWQHIHFIGHSAGSAVIEAMAKELKSAPNPPEIQETFLDPYTSFISLSGRGVYGANADWSDNYSALGAFLDVAPALLGLGNATVGKLDYSYNTDVGWVDPKRRVVPFGNGQIALASHGWPVDFYMKTITNADAGWCAYGYGFPLSKEGGGWNNNPVNHPEGHDPFPICGPQSGIQNPATQPTYTQLLFDGLAHAISSGVSLFSSWFTLSGSSSQPAPQADTKPGGPIVPNDGPTPKDADGGPAWLAVGLPITNAVDFVQFDAGFTSTNGAEGLMTVYWNTNQIGLVDERMASSGLQTYRFALPGTVTNGLYTLSFRLDAFTSTTSSVTVTNVATGYSGMGQRIKLDMLVMGSNGAPVLKLTGPSNFTYLVQSSTNLMDWTPAALLVNTNGAVLFADPAVTNRGARYYRALMP